ncbi:MAG: hypothetical protein R2699_09900 [Acidimicrobiales bacterium]
MGRGQAHGRGPRSAGTFADPLDDDVRRQLDLVDRTAAFVGIHAQQVDGRGRVGAPAPGLRRAVAGQLELVPGASSSARRRASSTSSPDSTPVRRRRGSLVATFLDRLPYELTGAQRRAVRELAVDLAGPHPMHRLLQGDVGAGKTVVALIAMLVAVQGGHQGRSWLRPRCSPAAPRRHRRPLDGLDVPDGVEVALRRRRPAAPRCRRSC